MISSKLGIAGLVDLHRVATGMHSDLGSMLSDPNAVGETLRLEFSKFFFTFQGLKGCSAQTAAAATISKLFLPAKASACASANLSPLVSAPLELRLRQCQQRQRQLGDSHAVRHPWRTCA